MIVSVKAEENRFCRPVETVGDVLAYASVDVVDYLQARAVRILC